MYLRNAGQEAVGQESLTMPSGGRVLDSCSRLLAEMKNPITVKLFTIVSIDSFSMR